MRQRRHIDFLLAANAVLLAALLWAMLATQPIGAGEVHAQSYRGAVGEGIPNAAGQRQKLIEETKETRKMVEKMEQLLRKGTIRVKVTNIDDLAGSDSD